MNKNPEHNISSPDYTPAFKIKPITEEKITGIHALDASNKIYQTINAAKAEAEKALEDSFFDHLTGCLNRNYYEKIVKNENFDYNRDNNKLGIIFVDLNDLKMTNDNHGHAAGDKLIKDTAEFLKLKFRKNDSVIRFGGDEFIIVCHNDTNNENFEENLSNRANEEMANAPVNLAFGSAVFDIKQDSTNLGTTVDRAGQRMYEHKRKMKSVR